MKALAPTVRFRHGLGHKSRQAGMLLLEVLIAILILSFGLLGLAGLQANVINSSVDVEQRTQAALLANDFVSQMRYLDFPYTTFPFPADKYAAWSSGVATKMASVGGGGAASYDAPTNTVTITITWQAHNNKGGKSSYVTKVGF